MALMDALLGRSELAVGERAPDFTLLDQDGREVKLSEYAGKKNVVLYFYPKDDTPGCTKESCAFRDQFAEFSDAGAEVLGVSADSVSSHKAFAEKYRLPFRLLADVHGHTRKAYRVPSTLGLLPGRVTFVIDKAGVIRHTFNSQVQATRHVEEALNVLRSLG